MSGFVLDAYAARSCPVKTHNRFDATLPNPDPSADESLVESFAGGLDFTGQVRDDILTRNRGRVTDLADNPSPDAALAAMDRGDELICSAMLPMDLVGHRTGRVFLLVRAADGGYRPVIAKRHRVLERRPGSATQAISGLDAPRYEKARHLPELGFRASRENDLLQLCHYWRMLEACGHASELIGGVIGTDRVPGSPGPHAISWVDLSERFIRTFSRTSETGWKKRSAIERYDHEHQFRVYVATTALKRHGAEDDPEPAVVPIVCRECERCVWWQTCRDQLHDENIGLWINKAPLDVREISALASAGISTVTQLATVDLEALLPTYLPKVRHREGAESRLRLAAHRAEMLAAGVELERVTQGPIEIPSAPVEVDFDIETSDTGQTYLWGFLVTRDGVSEYKQFSMFAEQTPEADLALFDEMVRWMVSMADEHGALFFHYSDYETVHLRQYASRSDEPAAARLKELFATHFVDLFPIVRQHFFAVNGLGLKVVAVNGPGFSWRDDDPNGLRSQTWFNEAAYGTDEAQHVAARDRVLDYNEDDVRATLALRAWLRDQR